MTIDLDALESTAKAATPGPWNIKHGYCLYDARDMHVVSAWEVYDGSLGLYINSTEATANAKFLEVANPAVVLELVAEVRRHRKAMTRLAKALRVKNRALAIAQRECKYAQERAAMNGRPV